MPACVVITPVKSPSKITRSKLVKLVKSLSFHVLALYSALAAAREIHLGKFASQTKRRLIDTDFGLIRIGLTSVRPLFRMPLTTLNRLLGYCRGGAYFER